MGKVEIEAERQHKEMENKKELKDFLTQLEGFVDSGYLKLVKVEDKSAVDKTTLVYTLYFEVL
jgi:hypothetical protein